MATATYEIAETDELEALGRDDTRLDTSAGLEPDEPVQQDEYDNVSESGNGKRKWCLCVVIAVLTLAAIATILGVFFSIRTKAGDSGTETSSQPSASSGNPASAGGDSSTSDANAGNLQPASPPLLKPSPVAAPQPASPPTPTTASEPAKVYTVEVLKSLPHDTGAFTQGFEFANGFFYESTGLRGQSSLRKVEMSSGTVLQKYDFKDMTLFGEGMTLHHSHHIFMLTWHAGRGFVFNQTSLEVIKEWRYSGEGWGLAFDWNNEEVFMSDGTTSLRVLDPEDLSEKRRVKVTLNGETVVNLNELEYVCGEIWSNVWMTSKIYRIDPATGVVKSVIDASILPLRGDRRPSSDVLNGIAFDKETGRLWFTGKKWTTIYQVRISDDSLDLTKCK